MEKTWTLEVNTPVNTTLKTFRTRTTRIHEGIGHRLEIKNAGTVYIYPNLHKIAVYKQPR